MRTNDLVYLSIVIIPSIVAVASTLYTYKLNRLRKEAEELMIELIRGKYIVETFRELLNTLKYSQETNKSDILYKDLTKLENEMNELVGNLDSIHRSLVEVGLRQPTEIGRLRYISKLVEGALH